MIELKKVKKKNEIGVVFNDTIRLLSIYGIAHILEIYIQKKKSLFHEEFTLMILYFIVGTIIYHLIVKQMIFFDES
jgi:hypothetical protein